MEFPLFSYLSPHIRHFLVMGLLQLSKMNKILMIAHDIFKGYVKLFYFRNFPPKPEIWWVQLFQMVLSNSSHFCRVMPITINFMRIILNILLGWCENCPKIDDELRNSWPRQ